WLGLGENPPNHPDRWPLPIGHRCNQTSLSDAKLTVWHPGLDSAISFRLSVHPKYGSIRRPQTKLPVHLRRSARCCAGFWQLQMSSSDSIFVRRAALGGLPVRKRRPPTLAPNWCAALINTRQRAPLARGLTAPAKSRAIRRPRRGKFPAPGQSSASIMPIGAARQKPARGLARPINPPAP